MDVEVSASVFQLLQKVWLLLPQHCSVHCSGAQFGGRTRMMRNNGMRIVDQDERGEMAKGSITRQSLSGMEIDLVRALVSR